jgi:hypothetical protein
LWEVDGGIQPVDDPSLPANFDKVNKRTLTLGLQVVGAAGIGYFVSLVCRRQQVLLANFTSVLPSTCKNIYEFDCMLGFHPRKSYNFLFPNALLFEEQ